MPKQAGTLRFMVCGSVDDGKSTLIGHLLQLTDSLSADQVQTLQDKSARIGTAGGAVDYALLPDGLMAEREEGGASEMAYRQFSTPRREFMVADTPCQECCTPDLASVASRCHAALILIDARQGIVAQTRRHTLICAMMGIRSLLFAVNRMDLVGYAEAAFQKTASDCSRLVAKLAGLGFVMNDAAVAPVCALHGDNLATSSIRTPWYTGPSILEWLEGAPVADGEAESAGSDIIAFETKRPELADIFKVRLVWMAQQPFFAGRRYLFRNPGGTATAEATRIRDRIDLNSFQLLAADRLVMDDIGEAELVMSRPVSFDPDHDNREGGSFVLIDPLTSATVACGMILHAMRRATNVHWQQEEVNREERACALGQKPRAIWFTGLSGSGKSTIANCLERQMLERGFHTVLLDGDNVRHGLNRDLGFSEADRIENIRRVGEVAKLMTDAGMVVITAFISPFQAERDMVRRLLPEGEFIEVFVDTPLEECERRDPKGLYRKARAGEIPNFTGISSPYQAPHLPEIRLDTTNSSAQECAELIIRHISGNFS